MLARLSMSRMGEGCPPQDCLGHQERTELEERIETRLQGREVRVVDLEGSVTILNGSNYKKMTLREVQESFGKSKEWEKIKTSFSTLFLVLRKKISKEMRKKIILLKDIQSCYQRRQQLRRRK